MSLLIGLLTVLLVLNCAFLMFLILLQLPKKEAGAGVAFGGGATEALFGAGSGNVLTKVTKYSAGIFMGLSLLLAVLNSRVATQQHKSLAEQLGRKAETEATIGGKPTNAAPLTPRPTLQLTTTNLAPAPAPAVTNAEAKP
jgi:preprotein translocase subunit SecG